MKKILYVRSGPYQPELNGYNLQEIGIAHEFIQRGYQCDVVYYDRKSDHDEIVESGNTKINVLFRHGIRLLRSGVYPQLLKKDFLDKYDYVICSEYSQIMSVLFCRKFKNTYIYNGPYYNLFKIPAMEIIYDKLFAKVINKNAQRVFCKTKASENYLHNKGILNTSVVGVGLDTSKFKGDETIEPGTSDLLKKMDGHRNILYVGSISDRKNVKVIYQAFDDLKRNSEYEDVQLVVIGKETGNYEKECLKGIHESTLDGIVRVNSINNSQLKFVYPEANLFTLASKYEIFGMVLLEAMYFGLPVIASNSAGANTLIDNELNGCILDDFNIKSWSEKMQALLRDSGLSKSMGDNAKSTILNKFMWGKIIDKLISDFRKDE